MPRGPLAETGQNTEPLLGFAGFLIVVGGLCFLIRWGMDKLADRARLRRMHDEVQVRLGIRDPYDPEA